MMCALVFGLTATTFGQGQNADEAVGGVLITYPENDAGDDITFDENTYQDPTSSEDAGSVDAQNGSDVGGIGGGAGSGQGTNGVDGTGGGVNGAAGGGVDGTAGNGSRGLTNPLKFDSLTGFLMAIINVILILAVPIIVLFIIYAGFLFVTARGNETQLETAKSALLWSVVGGVIVLGAKIILTIVQGTVDAFKV